MYLIVVDAFSKRVEIAKANTATSEATIEGLWNMFVTHGVPDTLVSDNGSCFTSEKFANFCSSQHQMGLLSGQFKRSRQTEMHAVEKPNHKNLTFPPPAAHYPSQHYRCPTL